MFKLRVMIMNRSIMQFLPIGSLRFYPLLIIKAGRREASNQMESGVIKTS